jgi:hypothetical protein
MKLQFNKYYFITFIVFFIVETLIAIYLKDSFIRHTFGDYLAVILLYCFFKSYIQAKPIHIALAVLLTAFTIEFSQLFNLQENSLAKIVFGCTFHVSDLLAYILGIVTVIIVELKRNPNGSN